MIQTKTQNSLGILFDGETSHGKITIHGIRIGVQGKRIQPGVFRAPGLEIHRLRCIRGNRSGIGDTGGKRKYYRGIRESKGIRLLGKFSQPQPHRCVFWRVRPVAGGGTYLEFQMLKRLRRTQNEGYGSLVVLRSDLIIDHIVFRNPFVPDTLPDAALGGVEHAAAVQGLLASGGVTGVGQIPDFYIERYRICVYICCDI